MKGMNRPPLKFASIEDGAEFVEGRIRKIWGVGDIREVDLGEDYGEGYFRQVRWRFEPNGNAPHAVWTWFDRDGHGNWTWDEQIFRYLESVDTRTGEVHTVDPTPDPAAIALINFVGHNCFNPFGLMDR